MVTAAQALDYLTEYVHRYRSEYERLTAPPPAGGGYPRVPVSPYQYGGHIVCHLAVDGAVLLDASREPAYAWQLAGGPAIMVDRPTSVTPEWVRETLDEIGLMGKSIGIYRCVYQSSFPDHVWQGDLGDPTESCSTSIGDLGIEVLRYPYSWPNLIQRLTFGALDLILDLHLPDVTAEFWAPRVIRGIGFFPADLTSSRFFHYAEFLRHTDKAAWDPRSAWTRAPIDVRRDFAHAATVEDQTGTLEFTHSQAPIGPPFVDRVNALAESIQGLEDLLREQATGPEALFHDYLLSHPVLLDLYGTAHSKPRFIYPEGGGPTGKRFVEPDFIIEYWNQTYKLIELERPDHALATRVGHPRVSVTHAAYQIAEWKDYIARHYELIKQRFPGISTGHTSMIVISRAGAESIGNAGVKDHYLSLLRQQLNVEEVLTYDDLIDRAREALDQLQRLAASLPA